MTVLCPVCGNHGEFQFSNYGKVLSTGQYGITIHPVMCRCSMIFLSPRWSRSKYSKYYSQKYDDLYRLESKPDVGIDGVIKNAEEVYIRIRRMVHKLGPGYPLPILDVGSAYGHALMVYKEKIDNALYE